MAPPIYEKAALHRVGRVFTGRICARYGKRVIRGRRREKIKKKKKNGDRDGKFDKRRAVGTDYTRWDAGSVRNVKGARKGINGGNAKINSERPTYRRRLIAGRIERVARIVRDT